MSKELFLKRAKEYFKNHHQDFLNSIDKPLTKSIFLNTNKASKEEILKIIDFKIKDSNLTDDSYYYECDNIGKTKAYELGLIYPQDIAASLSTKYLKDIKNINYVLDMCAAPGGKTINAINRLKPDCMFIANDVNHSRANILSSNLERLGLSNVIVTNKKIADLKKQLANTMDLVILDAPCSGEGMIRKYPEILTNYSLDNIFSLANIQKELLEIAYEILNEDSYLLYSTCTFAFEEDEDQVLNFLKNHQDVELVDLKNPYFSTLNETVKLNFINDTEGQFISLFHKLGNKKSLKFKSLKLVKDKLVDNFISENLNISDYYLYKNNERFYLSLRPLLDLNTDVLKYGIYIGETINNKRFEVSHEFYRSNLLKGKYKYTYDLDDDEYNLFVKGNPIKADLCKHYYQITYQNHSLGFGKYADGFLKNKYPKGLRRML